MNEPVTVGRIYAIIASLYELLAIRSAEFSAIMNRAAKPGADVSETEIAAAELSVRRLQSQIDTLTDLPVRIP